MQKVILIEKGEERRVAFGHSAVARCRHAAVFLIYQTKMRISAAIFFDDFRGSVGRTVVDQYDFKIGKALSCHRIQTGSQVAYGVI